MKPKQIAFDPIPMDYKTQFGSQRHLSSKLISLFEGTHDVSMLDSKPPLDGLPSARYMRIAALVLLYDAVMQLGWIEHTSDWDWRLHVTLDDGTTVPNQTEDEEEWTDTIELDEDDYTTISIEVFNDEDSKPQTVQVEKIRSITLERA